MLLHYKIYEDDSSKLLMKIHAFVVCKNTQIFGLVEDGRRMSNAGG
jgi:hypothetical protein